MKTHWHAFEYTGRGYSDSQIRRGDAPSSYPPIEVKHWLARRKAGRIPHVAAFTEEQIGDAVAWLEKELNAHLPLDAGAFPVQVRIEYSRRRLLQEVNRDVVYGYWSMSGQYVSRALILCDINGPACQ